MLLGIKWTVLLRNPIIIALLFTSIVSLAAILERLFHFAQLRFNYENFIKRIKVFVSKKEIDTAVKFCDSYKHPIARVTKEGLKNAGLTRNDIFASLERAQIQERNILENHVGTLSTIAFIGPLMGLLGTVLGIVEAFSKMAAKGGGTPTEMMGGIAIALLTTAIGISIAVPAAIVFGIFSGKVDGLHSKMQESSKTLMRLMSRNGLINEKGGIKIKRRKEVKEKVEAASQASEALTPGINMALLLILFFMIFAPLMYETNITVSAPALAKSKQTPEQQQKKTELKLNIHIRADESIYINNEKMPADIEFQNQLMTELLKRSLERLVILSADENVFHYLVVNMIDRATQCGAEKVCILKRKMRK